MGLRIDYTNMMGDVVQGGIAASDWAAAPQKFADAHRGFQRRRAAGDLGFLDLPGDRALHQQTTAFAKRVNGKFDDVVVLGIGG